MDTSTFITLAMIGLAAGTLSGMVGLGGGIIIIPAMVYLLGVDQRMAQGTSIALMLPPIGVFAAYNYYKAGYINIKYAIVIALTFFIGGYIGSKLSLALPEATVKKVFAGIMIITALKMMIGK
ncbi:MAG: sulfite exporter TauE/SafE family protein [Bacteroidetes bacterium]|nr:sulfite exporter TauE/SafE family protein [Bacteroidota bacterium]